MSPTKFDTDDDGVLSQFEIEATERKLRIENEDKKQDAQRHMVWVALGGMLTFPLLVVVVSLMGFDSSLEVLGSIAPTYFVSVSAVVAAYFAKEGYIHRLDTTSIIVDQEL